MSNLKHLTVLLVVALASTITLAVSGKNSRQVQDDPANIKKAEYIYLEAANARSENRLDDYYMLLRRASALNPSDPYIAASLAEVEAPIVRDSIQLQDIYRRLGARFEAMRTESAYYLPYAKLASLMWRLDDEIYIWSKLDSLMPSRTDPAVYLAGALRKRYMQTLDTADFNRAIAVYDRLERAAGPTLPIMAQKVQTYLMRKDTLAVERSLSTLAAAAPKDVDANIFIGQVYDYLGKADSTLYYYNRAEQADTTDGSVYLARAEFFHAQGDSVAYDREVFHALRSQNIEFPQKFELLSDYVVKLYTDSAQRPRIEQMFETLLDVNPGEADLHALYGGYKAEIGELPSAAEQFSYSIDLDPNQRQVWTNLIQVYSSMSDSIGLLETSEKALNIFPHDPYFSLMGSFALATQDRYPQAMAVLDSIDMSGVDNQELLSVIYSTRGDYMSQMGERDSAVVEYTKAIEVNAENYMAMNNCAYYMALAGSDLVRAELYASIATAADPANATFLDTYAWVLFKKKDFVKAREVIDQALGTATEDTPEFSADIYDHAGDIYFMSGDHREALDFWKKALKLDPDNKLLKKKVEHKTIFFEEQ